MEKKAIVELNNLVKQFGHTEVIKDISLKIYPGEVFGFLGPNGAGKTTTIRMMVGLMGITKGEVIINGYSIEKNFEKAIEKVGAIIENPEMYKFLTGYDNLIHYARMIPKPINKDRINEVVKLVGLEKRINDKVGNYSLGMRQRLGLAQALLHSPTLLILDEPTNGLDPAGIKEIRNYIRKIALEDNIAVFVSSHLLSEMQLMCDRIGIIQNGNLLSVETVGNFVGQSNELTVQMVVTPLQEAFQFIKATFKETIVEMNGKQLHLQAELNEIPKLNEALVKSGFKVFGITTNIKSLEDKFLEMTEGK